MKGILVFVTVPNSDVGSKIARMIVEEKLAACVNILPGVTSIYHWQGKINEDNEAVLLVKSVSDNFENLSKRIAEIHPYECPEIVAVNIENGFAPYLKWLFNSCH